ncbi:hypothetical protein [Streptomyces atratus]|uniref:hypothetical protein n=1 Tax=Streptomyces atratus TaxID=1893 RepID=UPI0021A44937|nr:hypothetical protein [Streptomyces atratus]MCT2548416.1 hypothetical protein [Streptomyces atratus]
MPYWNAYRSSAFQQPFGDNRRSAPHAVPVVEALQMGIDRANGHAEMYRCLIVTVTFGNVKESQFAAY